MSKVRIGMIGCGGMARAHLRQIEEIPEAEVTGLADPDPAQIEQCRKQFPALENTRSFSDYREMLDGVEMDAVQVDTPHTQHVEQTLASFAKGLHVLCEKPLVTSTEDAHRVIAARDKAGKVGLLSYQRHYSPEFRHLKSEIASERFGPVTYVHALLGQAWKRGTKGAWRQNPALSGGGQLNDSGSHIVDALLWATGLEVRQVSAFCDNRDTPVDIDSTVSIRFSGGAIGSLSILGEFPIWNEDWTISCCNGGFMIRGGKITLVDGDGACSPAEKLPLGSNPDVNFVRAILHGEPVEATFEDGLRVIRLTEAAWKSSAKGGAPVSLV